MRKMHLVSLKTTRTLVVAGIGLAMTAVAALMLALTYRNDIPELSTRITPERTLAYIRTARRTELLRWTTRLEDLATGPEVKDVPENDFYELAYLKDGTGADVHWVLYGQDLGHGVGHTLTSSGGTRLLLPTDSRNESLSETPFFSRNVSRVATDVVWLKPDALPAQNDDVRHVLQAMMFGGTQVIIMPAGDDHGTIVIDGTIRFGRRMPPAILQERADDVLWASSANGIDIVRQFDASLTTIDAGLATGLRGIAASWAESKALRDYPELWSLPLSLAVRDESGATVTFVAGVFARSVDSTRLKDLLLAESAKGTVRHITLAENVRNDVIAEHNPMTETVGDWNVTDVGGSSELFFASQGPEFVLATNHEALKRLLLAPGNKATGSPLSLSMNVDDGFGHFGRSVPFLGTPLKQTFRRLLGLGVTQIALRALPSSSGSAFEWSVKRGSAETRTGN